MPGRRSFSTSRLRCDGEKPFIPALEREATLCSHAFIRHLKAAWSRLLTQAPTLTQRTRDSPNQALEKLQSSTGLIATLPPPLQVVLTNPLAAEAKGLEDKEQVPPASSGAALGTRRPLTARKHPVNTHKPPVAPTPASTPAWPGLVQLGVAVVLLVYPVVATAALRLVHCESLPQAGDGLHGSVLASKPWIRCGGADHMTAAGVAAAALAVMVAGACRGAFIYDASTSS